MTFNSSMPAAGNDHPTSWWEALRTGWEAMKTALNGKVGSNGTVIRVEYYSSDAALPTTLETGVLYITPDA